MQQQQLHRPPEKMYAFEGGWDLTRNVASSIIGKATTNAGWWSHQIGSLQDAASDAEGAEKFFYYTGAVISFFINIVQYCILMLVMLVCVFVLALIFSIWAG